MDKKKKEIFWGCNNKLDDLIYSPAIVSIEDMRMEEFKYNVARAKDETLSEDERQKALAMSLYLFSGKF